ncbi:MAG: hypothetical protein AAGD09_17405 [Cyanobacteria bacterium P01_F01_bin.56]
MSSDISVIREQLLAANSPSQADPELPLPPGPGSPDLPWLGATHQAWPTSQRADMAQALRQRSISHSGQMPPTPEEISAPPVTGEVPSEPVNIHRYLQRLHGEAERINELYHQQEAAIRKFQSSVHGLSLILMKQPHAAMLRAEQFCEIREAALTTVIQDDQNRYILTAVDLDLALDEREASATAAHLRSRSKGLGHQHNPQTQPVMAGLVQKLSGFWQALTKTLENDSQIKPFDILVWSGGGIIGRLILDLALATFPGLWPWVIGATIGAVALGLYRLLFASKPDAAFITRLFLALFGLGIGGQI